MRHKRPDRINVVFKFYHFYDIKIDGRRVTDVKAQLLLRHSKIGGNL